MINLVDVVKDGVKSKQPHWLLRKYRPGVAIGRFVLVSRITESQWLSKCSICKREKVIVPCAVKGFSKTCFCSRRASITGQRHFSWRVLEKLNNGLWKVECKCGNIRRRKKTSILNGKPKSCGCLRRTIEIKKGDRFGKLTAIKTRSHKGEVVSCICTCGRRKEAVASSLKNGHTTSCGSCRKIRVSGGSRFGKLKVLSQSADGGIASCICDCGRERTVAAHRLTAGHLTSCGKCRTGIIHNGDRFGMLTAIADRSRGDKFIECRCDCGKKVRARGTNLIRGLSKSCGCLRTKKKRPISPGQRFGRLSVVRETGTDKHGFRRFLVTCQCGRKFETGLACFRKNNPACASCARGWSESK